MPGATRWDMRGARKSNGLGGNLDRQICGSGDVFHCRRSAANRSRCGGCKARCLCEHTSGRSRIHISVEREGRIYTGAFVAHENIAQKSGEAAGGCGTPQLLRRARVHRHPDRGGISRVSCLDREMSRKSSPWKELGRPIRVGTMGNSREHASAVGAQHAVPYCSHFPECLIEIGD